jgi:type IV secretion system protein VirB1
MAGLFLGLLSWNERRFKNLLSTSGQIGIEGGNSRSSGHGAAWKGTAPSKVSIRLSDSFGSIIRAASRFFPKAIANWLSSRAWLKPIFRVTRTLLLSAAAQIAIHSPVNAAPLTLPHFVQLANQCGRNVAVSTLAAIAQTESGLNPFSIHDNTSGITGTPEIADEAAAIANKLMIAGHSVDVGLMQINSMNFAVLGLTVETALDPCRSIEAGAIILTNGYMGGANHAQQQAALRIAISRYNTGDATRGFANGYVHRVEDSNTRVVPALDLDGVPVSNPAPVTPKQVAAAQASNGAPPWEIFPADAQPQAEKDAASTGNVVVASTDAEKKYAAPVVSYPGPSTERNEVP